MGNANFAWVQHVIQRVASTVLPSFILTNGSISPNQLSRAT